MVDSLYSNHSAVRIRRPAGQRPPPVIACQATRPLPGRHRFRRRCLHLNRTCCFCRFRFCHWRRRSRCHLRYRYRCGRRCWHCCFCRCFCRCCRRSQRYLRRCCRCFCSSFPRAFVEESVATRRCLRKTPPPLPQPLLPHPTVRCHYHCCCYHCCHHRRHRCSLPSVARTCTWGTCCAPPPTVGYCRDNIFGVSVNGNERRRQGTTIAAGMGVEGVRGLVTMGCSQCCERNQNRNTTQHVPKTTQPKLK